jgi:arylsulfatase A-like enzyme
VPKTWTRPFGKTRDFGWAFVTFPREKMQEVRNLYADALAYSDEQAGRLFQALKRLGRWDETIVIATSDHGEAFLEHGFAGHASRLYQECLRVPLVFRGPGVVPGVDARPAQMVDLAPSVLGLIGLPSHPSFQGLNLFASDFPAIRTRYMVAQTSFAMQTAIERGGLKLISDQELELDLMFDLRKDPGETTDLSQSHPAARDLAWRLQTWRQAQLDYFSSPERYRKEYPPILVEK